MERPMPKRRRVTPTAQPRQPVYEPEYGLAVESPVSMGSRISVSGDEDFGRTSVPETSTPPAPRPLVDAEKAEQTPLTMLVLKSQEFLKSKSLVRNRHDEIDWVATFLKVGFDPSSIYALMCPLRKGRWKSEEEKYTLGLLRLIENGTILLRHGQSIRGYIGEKLHSDDMRVLKKLSNCKMFHFAKLINPRLAENEKLDMTVAGAQEGMERLDLLKGEFLRSVQLEALVAVRNPASTPSVSMKRPQDQADATPTHKSTFTLQIDATVESGVFEAPGFRFRFLDGSRRQTTAIGSNPGWTPVQTNESSETSPASPARFRYEQNFPDIAISEAFAAALDDDPILSFFLFDHPGLAGVGTTPRAQSKEAKPLVGKTPAAAAVAAPPVAPLAVDFTPKAFAGLYEMDVSSLLAGALQLKQVWALSPHTEQAMGAEDIAGDVFGSKLTPSEIQLPAQSLCILPSASGLKYLSIQVIVDRPVLAGDLLKRFNPLTLTIGAARRLPGAVSQGIGRASPHLPLQRFCKPAFALIHFFPDQLEPSSSITNSASTKPHSVPRVLLTPGQHQSGTVRWNASVTVLCGRYDSLELVDAIRFGALTVEIRDRDLKQEETLARYQLKWESLYSTGVDPSEVQQDSSLTILSSRSTPRSNDTSQPPTLTSTAAPPVKPMELSAVDDIARSDWRMLLVNSSRLFPYGLARFRLVDLLNTAKQSMGGMRADSDRPYMGLKLTTDIIAMKRRASPLGTASLSEESELPATVDLSPLEKVIREPGAYVTTSASLSIRLELQSPIEIVESTTSDVFTVRADDESPASIDGHKHPSTLKFSRMVVIIPYKDKATLGEITKAMITINLQALPGVPIRSYQMTETEKLDCEGGALDVITGTQIIDSQFRMIILEGLADRGMKYLHEQLQRKGPNDPQGYRMFSNGELRFTRRLYTVFEIDLKRIKLRYPLPVLMTTPDIYMRTKVSENCHQALARLADMRKVQRLIEVKQLDLFPTAKMLLEVESKYGESITLEDIHGSNDTKSSVPSKFDDNNYAREHTSHGKARDNELTATSTKHRIDRLKAPTDSTNASFEQSRRSRVEKNFLLERKNQGNQAKAEYAAQKQIAAMLEDKAQVPVYLRDFQSVALSMVNPEALRQTEELEDRKKWTTKRGFVYPAPRQPGEYYKHANAPSEARCEDLRQPFVDNASHPKPVSRDSDELGSKKDSEFSTLPSKDMVFGGTNGDGTVNHDYFRSVHLCGERLRLEMEEALKKEQDEWERRLVVDKKQLKFLAHGNICSLPRIKPSQLDKVSDILKGPTNSKSIRIVKNAMLPSGKRVPLEKAPVTIHNQEEYAGCVAATFANTLRPSDSNQFIATDVMSGKPKDFFFPSTTNILTPPVKKFITRKEITPVREVEKRGLVWRNE
ncbi:unnamed protein product [Phytophthora fragariaefolia]|uniref:Unnamed protein product n=1 Tax=Phytophthora fragariaefolia TaxID=1490495 RepID=A0A9W6Y419_9STRA|nr:unnamed protein product [Phytophthora fragariaefolia]